MEIQQLVFSKKLTFVKKLEIWFEVSEQDLSSLSKRKWFNVKRLQLKPVNMLLHSAGAAGNYQWNLLTQFKKKKKKFNQFKKKNIIEFSIWKKPKVHTHNLPDCLRKERRTHSMFFNMEKQRQPKTIQKLHINGITI